MNMTLPNTEARAALARLLKEKTAIQRDISHAQEQTKSLYTAERAVVSVQRHLDKLAESERSAVAAWSNGETPAPVLDKKARAALEVELKAATERVAEARTIAAPFVEVIERFNDRMRQNALDIELAKLDVMVETIGPAIERLELAASDLVRSRDEVVIAADFIANLAREVGRLDTGSPDMTVARPMLAAVETLNGRVSNALAKLAQHRFMPLNKADKRWSDFATALSRDDSAELDAA